MYARVSVVWHVVYVLLYAVGRVRLYEHRGPLPRPFGSMQRNVENDKVNRNKSIPTCISINALIGS